MIIYLDMDGVLANFDSKSIELIGKPLKSFPTSLLGWMQMEKHQNIYAILDKMPDADELVDGVFALAAKHDCTVGVLTAIPWLGRIPLATQHKQEWLAEKFPQYPDLLTNFNIGPHARDKQNHCKPNHVLIDDSHLNIPQWIAKGGCGILHTQAKLTLPILKTHLESITR
jgi:hypothetical protein